MTKHFPLALLFAAALMLAGQAFAQRSSDRDPERRTRDDDRNRRGDSRDMRNDNARDDNADAVAPEANEPMSQRMLPGPVSTFDSRVNTEIGGALLYELLSMDDPDLNQDMTGYGLNFTAALLQRKNKGDDAAWAIAFGGTFLSVGIDASADFIEGTGDGMSLAPECDVVFNLGKMSMGGGRVMRGSFWAGLKPTYETFDMNATMDIPLIGSFDFEAKTTDMSLHFPLGFGLDMPVADVIAIQPQATLELGYDLQSKEELTVSGTSSEKNTDKNDPDPKISLGADIVITPDPKGPLVIFFGPRYNDELWTNDSDNATGPNATIMADGYAALGQQSNGLRSCTLGLAASYTLYERSNTGVQIMLVLKCRF